MRRLSWVLLATALFVTLPVAAETLLQCMNNCLPGVNPCSNCCFAQYDAAKGPCFEGCRAAQKPCFDAAWAACHGDRTCFAYKSGPCDNAAFMCQRNCDGVVQIAGGCPGEVPPQKCPYNCQAWNPASQSCIGPMMNVCGDMLQKAVEDAADDEAERHAARAKEAEEKAAAETQEMQKEAKAPKKKKN